MKHTILIAEDVAVNRLVLCKILSEEYHILQAENGREALDLIERNPAIISAIILDLGMPVMDGFAVMDAMRSTDAYRNIPILVTTGNDDRESELRALKGGAWDFVAKPYDPDILRFRLHNAIERSKLNLFEQLKRQAEFDSLTGLFNEHKFCERARELLDANPDKPFAIVRFDVDRFKQFNSFFGMEEGNRFLCYIAGLLNKVSVKYPLAAYGRIDADVFAVCVYCPDIGELRRLIEVARTQIRSYSDRFDIVTVYGVYVVEDRSLSVNAMLDRATLAARTCKGNYLSTVAVYTNAMGEAVERDQEIINSMNAALEEGQFCVYYQPKYNIATNRPYGAEALVRWRHPQKGMISPGVFIPVFEKNGFVAKVDYFVWDRTCQNLRRWVDEGINPDPISVNISRVNLSNPQIVEIITELVQRHGIQPRLLQLEITESAYMDNPEIMDQVVAGFHRNGFTVLMDDFGSGYSSLNTLKDISVDVLKIDMKFLPTGDNNTKSEKILASMIRMADWIGMPVICEGVETVQQRDFLHSVGCLFVQGYFYGKPMPVDSYEALIRQTYGKPTPLPDYAVAVKELDSLLSADGSAETLLRSISIPVAIYSCDNGSVERIRANRSYFDAFGYHDHDAAHLLHVSPNEGEKLKSAFTQAIATHGTAECEVLFIMDSGVAKWYRLGLRYIMPVGSSHIICAVFTEITDAKRVQNEMARIVGILNRSTPETLRTMLVIDDSDVSRALLQTIFSTDFRVLEAENGRVGLEQLKKHTDEISMILLDMMMPEMNGAEFLAMKSRMDGAARIPVVIISADSSENSQVNMLRLGVNDYITKPFVPEVVYQRVRNVLEYQSRFERLVSEYRQALSLSPEIGPHLTDNCLTLGEARSLVAFLSPIFDVVRLVDPTSTAILTLNQDGRIERQPYSCFRVWQKETRCENCTSICALEQGCQLSKYEFIDSNIFYVVSRPLTLILPEQETPLKVVLEIVSHVSDSLLAGEVNGVPMRKILEDTRKRIYNDPLTEAYNRRYLGEMLFTHHGRSTVTGRIAFVMADLNGFKRINDAYGHAEGDRVLVEVTKALTSQTRQSDSVIRYGGDEFLLVLTGYAADRLPEMTERLARAVREVKLADGTSVSAEFGYAVTEDFDCSQEQLDALIQQADAMMYVGKRSKG